MSLPLIEFNMDLIIQVPDVIASVTLADIMWHHVIWYN